MIKQHLSVRHLKFSCVMAMKMFLTICSVKWRMINETSTSNRNNILNRDFENNWRGSHNKRFPQKLGLIYMMILVCTVTNIYCGIDIAPGCHYAVAWYIQ